MVMIFLYGVCVAGTWKNAKNPEDIAPAKIEKVYLPSSTSATFNRIQSSTYSAHRVIVNLNDRSSLSRR